MDPPAPIVSAIVVDAVSVPEVPMIVTVVVPVAAVVDAVSVRRLLPPAGFGTNAAVTPLGRPDVVNVTLLANPPTAVTLMVEVPLPPWATDTVDGADAMVKLGVWVLMV